MPDAECRIAKLEERVQILQSDHHEYAEKSDRKLSEVYEVVCSIKNTQSSQKGFIAGITFAVSSIFAVAVYFLNKH